MDILDFTTESNKHVSKCLEVYTQERIKLLKKDLEFYKEFANTIISYLENNASTITHDTLSEILFHPLDNLHYSWEKYLKERIPNVSGLDMYFKAIILEIQDTIYSIIEFKTNYGETDSEPTVKMFSEIGNKITDTLKILNFHIEYVF